MQDITLHKNDLLTVTITDLSDDGSGIGHADNGCTLFIKDAVVGDVVRCKVMKTKRNYAFARLMEVLEPSPDRVVPACPVARQCGGCQIQAMSYEAQLRFKAAKVRNDLIRIGGFSEADVDGWMQPIVGMEEPWRYRNKAQFPVGMNRDGQLIAGFYAGRTHSVIACKDCLLGSADNQAIMNAVLAWMRENHVSAYDEESGKGVVRHVLIRSGVYSGKVMVCVVANVRRLPDEEALVTALSALPGMTSICLNTNTQRTNVIMGDETRTLWGKDVITDDLHVYDVLPCESRTVQSSSTHCAETVPAADTALAHSGRYTYVPTGRSVTFRISARSFYQVNPRQTERLYSIARAYAGLTGNEVVWDLYCGVGTISLFMADAAKEVFGVEVIPQAIEDARRNAVLNGVTNATYMVGKVEEVLPAYVMRRMQEEHASAAPDVADMNQLSASGRAAVDHTKNTDPTGLVDVVVVDPPRKGCDRLTLDTILQVRPERIVYVSCDPATLARDLRILADGGYHIRAVTPVDQFPHTVHVETVCWMSRVSNEPCKDGENQAL